ncbi:hypothetical protein MSG28_009653 [Choristoneura fumiferana]|uniref:Uncharacterized protein n=1 Tax=Choristoneura fumiferana TaxID=7141 RepID=A0ACC0JC32_CHOFU|nr:hypothetical protein MSG28_009653 [Choristoneura fumiferana]
MDISETTKFVREKPMFRDYPTANTQSHGKENVRVLVTVPIVTILELSVKFLSAQVNNSSVQMAHRDIKVELSPPPYYTDAFRTQPELIFRATQPYTMLIDASPKALHSDRSCAFRIHRDPAYLPSRRSILLEAYRQLVSRSADAIRDPSDPPSCEQSCREAAVLALCVSVMAAIALIFIFLLNRAKTAQISVTTLNPALEVNKLPEGSTDAIFALQIRQIRTTSEATPAASAGNNLNVVGASAPGVQPQSENYQAIPQFTRTKQKAFDRNAKEKEMKAVDTNIKPLALVWDSCMETNFRDNQRISIQPR